MEKSCFGFSFGRRTYGQETTDMATKTGTTISGVKYAEGIVLGADTRSTSGATVADKNCEKIHYIAPNIYCCGAGTAADTEALTGKTLCITIRNINSFSGLIASNLKLHQLASRRESRTVTALTMLKTHLFKYQGHIGAALVLGGFDEGGAHLYTVYPHGSSDSLPFATMGSGSLAAMSVFESDYNDNMNEEEAKLLVARSIRAGIFNDLGSGSNVDLCVINKEGTKYFRNYMTPNNRTYSRTKGYDHPPGTTVLNSRNFTTGTAATVPVTALK